MQQKPHNLLKENNHHHQVNNKAVNNEVLQEAQEVKAKVKEKERVKANNTVMANKVVMEITLEQAMVVATEQAMAQDMAQAMDTQEQVTEDTATVVAMEDMIVVMDIQFEDHTEVDVQELHLMSSQCHVTLDDSDSGLLTSLADTDVFLTTTTIRLLVESTMYRTHKNKESLFFGKKVILGC